MATLTALPVIAARGIVIFPKTETTIEIARPFTNTAIKASKESEDLVVVAAQKDLSVEDPVADDIYETGTICKVKQYIKIKGQSKVLLEGLYRAKLSNITYNGSFYQSDCTMLFDDEQGADTNEGEAARKELENTVDEYVGLMPHISEDIWDKVAQTDSLGEICDIYADNFIMPYDKRQSLLEEQNTVFRTFSLINLLSHDIEILKLEFDIASKVRTQIDKSQRDYYLKEQLKVIQNELSDDDGFASFSGPGEDEETAEYLDKLSKIKCPDNVREKLTKDIYKLEKLPFSSPEYTVLKTYIDACLEIPFGKFTTDTLNIEKTRKILDADHYGLKKVKDRICEFVAAKKYNPEYKGQILCFVGPPGVGKTSIASSIARALGRTMVRISLGGIHDEADIRGHRKTYIGAMPGRIINAIINAKVMNPLILFDEIDKLGTDGYHGDPSSALLEVLDVEQNKKFRDHFVEFDVDLSDCLFICTANTSSTIPRPLLDRMEVVELSTYTENEKIHIAKNHLIPKQYAAHGLTKKDLNINDKAIVKLIELYTREAGVRNLEREIATVCRKSVCEILSKPDVSIKITDGNIDKYAGNPKFIKEQTEKTDEVGIVNGLAWTEVGGEMLQVEASVMEGTGKLELTGSLGDVMKESAHAAITYIRSNSKKLGICDTFYKDKDIHLHFPDGATPKDGPSAGIAITTCLISALTGKKVLHNVAMTGEVTIRGKVLPIGGLREKTMAAAGHKMTTVLIPAANVPDLAEIDDEVKSVLSFIPVNDMDEVLTHVFAKNKTDKNEKKKRAEISGKVSYIKG